MQLKQPLNSVRFIQKNKGKALARISESLFVTPAVIAVVALMVFPVAYTVYLSFTDWTPTSLGSPEITGFQNYTELILHDERFLNALWRTIWYSVVGLSLQCVLGVGLALIFNREFVGRGILRTIFLMPMVAAPVAIALVWMMILDINTGILNYLLDLAFGLRVPWLSGRQVVLWPMILIDTWQWTPFVMLITLAGLASLPTEPFEAAVMDGASSFQLFRHITFPMLRPTILVALMFRGIDALKTFDVIYVITQGGPAFASETLNLYAFLQGFSYFNMGYASAILVLYFMLVMGISLLFSYLRNMAAEAL